ncbi:MAG: hypothetical protein HRU19_28030 [Pseudobacteriovorax sp.]|nr:hypothetical protein [Pseudobacteriovorax sp.]
MGLKSDISRSLLLGTFIVGCSIAADDSIVTYELETTASSNGLNRLLLSTQGEARSFFSLSGDGFAAEVEKDTIHPVLDSVEILAEDEGLQKLTVTLYNRDQVPYLTDSLFWEYRTTRPSNPDDLYFSEEATADDLVSLIIPNNKEPAVVDIWLEGDLSQSLNGKWLRIPSDGVIPLQVSAADGFKGVNVKYRNIFGVESTTFTYKILKKSTPPSSCSIRAFTTTSNELETSLEITAIDPYPLRYRLMGDITSEVSWLPMPDNNQIDMTLKKKSDEPNKSSGSRYRRQPLSKFGCCHHSPR